MTFLVHHDGTVTEAHTEYFARWGEYRYCGVSGTTEREAVTRWAKDRHEVAAVADTEDDAREIYAAPPLRIPPTALAAMVAPFDAVLTEDHACAGCTELLSAGAAVVGVGTSHDGLPLLAYCSAACRSTRNAAWREALGRGCERTEVVRADLADTARRLGHRCIAREIERAVAPDAWGDVAHDLDRVGVTQDDRALARSTARAVRLLASGDLDGAVAELADFCGLTPAEWERVTRAEQGR